MYIAPPGPHPQKEGGTTHPSAAYELQFGVGGTPTESGDARCRVSVTTGKQPQPAWYHRSSEHRIRQQQHHATTRRPLQVKIFAGSSWRGAGGYPIHTTKRLSTANGYDQGVDRPYQNGFSNDSDSAANNEIYRQANISGGSWVHSPLSLMLWIQQLKL